jgi:hypothetical protein
LAVFGSTGEDGEGARRTDEAASLEIRRVVGYVNARPFRESETLWFVKYLNVGTSVVFGHQNQPPVPAELFVGAVAPDASIPGLFR